MDPSDSFMWLKLSIDYKEDKGIFLRNEMVKLEAKRASEEAVSRLMKQKQDMEASLKDLEEEIVDLAGKVKPKIQFCKKIPSSLNPTCILAVL